MITIYCTHVPIFFCDALIDMLYIMLNAVRRKLLILKFDLYIRNHYAIRNTLVPLFTMASFILMCANCKMYVYHYIIPLLLILCGDIELNPGPNIVMNENLSIYHINVRSLRNKVDIVSTHAGNYDIVAITEAKLDRTIPTKLITLSGFSEDSVYRRDNTINSGGICVQLSHKVHGARLLNFEEEELEILWLKITAHDKTLILGTVYRNPALSVAYWDKLHANISRVVDFYGSQSIVILGDLNEDLLNPRLHHLQDIIDTFALEQQISEPTRTTEHSATLLDPIICSPSLGVNGSQVLVPYCSDHCPVACYIKLEKPKTRSFKRRVWLFDRANWEYYRLLLSDINWNEIFESDCINTIVSEVTTCILECAGKAIPSKTIKYTNKDKPWINQDIKRQIQHRDTLYKKARKSGRAKHYDDFKKQRNKVVHLVRNAKKTYQQQIVNKMSEQRFSDKNWWRLMKTVINPDGGREWIPPLKYSNSDEMAFNDIEKAELLNQYFISVNKTDDENAIFPEVPLVEETLSNFQITIQDVHDAFKLIDVSKAYGCDDVNPRFLSNATETLVTVYFNIYTRCIDKHDYPTLWKQSSAVPIFKKGDKQLPSNYRPISLLSIGGKVFERIIHKKLYNHVRLHITPYQSGFLPGHSTTTQLLEIYHNIMQKLDNQEELVFTFFDISKAFDKVSHKALLHKLQTIGITGDALKLIENYLSGRKQKVVINGSSSSWKEIKDGVPQGSILGPLLFLIFINDIVQNIASDIRLFADDTSLYNFLNYLNDNIETIQHDINNLSEWAKKWFVKFNEEKTKLMVISRKLAPTDINLTMNNIPLSHTTTHKHLGLTLDNNGTWNQHISDIVQKANKKVGIMRNLKYTLNRKSLELLYKAYVRPVLEYADIVWDGIPEYLVERIEKVQIESLRIISGLTISCSLQNIYRETGFRPLSERRKEHRIIMMYKILNGHCPNYLLELIPPRLADRHDYPTRRRDNIIDFYCRTEAFARSFFPTTLKDWNALPVEVKQLPTLSIFKLEIRKRYFNTTIVPHWYYIGKRNVSVILCRMRNKCSALNYHLYINHVIDSPTCLNCDTNQNENVEHFFFDCMKYINIRHVFLDSLHHTMYNNNTPDYPISPHALLFGVDGFDETTNSRIVNATLNYINSSRRFNDVPM